MKIQGSLPIAAVEKSGAQARDASVRREVEEERVVLSETARFIQSLRENMVDEAETREALVSVVRSEIEAGSFGSDEDYERAVDSLLPEL